MKNNKKRREKKTDTKKQTFTKKWSTGGIVITVIIIAFFSPTFKYDFVNWDDDVNVYENANVVNFNTKGIFTDHVIGNYNPLTTLTFAMEYKMVQDDPRFYHLNNVILHILCTLLVYLLMKRLGLSFFTSFLIAILFGIHPMRVESVAWITERKDLLFSLFYLISLHFYVSYFTSKKRFFYLLSISIFILSLLSKIQAVALPFSLLLIDYWMGKKPDLKSVMEKVPFFLLSLITGLAGIYFLRQQGSLDAGQTLPIFQRLFIGSYSYIIYILKSVFPFQMTAVYPYPDKLTALHYSSIVPAIVVFLVAVFARKSKKSLTFGILFFTLNIVFVLQVVGAGQGFTADRFTYIPYIGLFFIYAIFIENAIIKFQKQKTLVYSFIGIYLVLLSIGTAKQIKVWKNGETLWTDVIVKEPKVAVAYNNLGHYYRQNNEYDKALENYNMAISLVPEKAQTYSNRGKIYFDRQEYDLALDDYNRCLSLDPKYSEALANRGAVFGIKKEYEKALTDLTKALSIDPFNTNALSNRGFVYYNLKEYEKSITDCTKYVQLKPNDADITNMLGLCYMNLKDYNNAIRYYNRSIELNASNPIFYANRSYALNASGDKTNALKDAIQAKNLGFNVNPAYLEMLNKQ